MEYIRAGVILAVIISSFAINGSKGDVSAIGIIGGADGPTSIYIAGKTEAEAEAVISEDMADNQEADNSEAEDAEAAEVTDAIAVADITEVTDAAAVAETSVTAEEVIAEPIIEPEPIIVEEEPAAAENISTNQGRLSGTTIVIDAGHQGKGDSTQEPVAPWSSETKARVTSGTTGKATGIPEYKLNLEVALKLRDRLAAEGVNVVMVRETHDVNISNSERATMANNIGADLVIRLHGDGSEDPNVNGYSMHVPGSSSIRNENVRAQSEAFGYAVLGAMEGSLDMKSRGLFYRNDLSGFNWLEVPGILIEMGYMSNYSDDVKMNSPEYQSALVEAITQGLINYYS